MKKKLFILGIGILVVVGLLTFYFVKKYNDNLPKKLPNGVVVYDFEKQNNQTAVKILYEHIYDFYYNYPLGKREDILSELYEEDIKAIWIDLNDDGESEIIGYIDNKSFETRYGYILYIIEKDKKSYKDISRVLGLARGSKIYVLPQKYNGYKKIIILSYTGYTKGRPNKITYKEEYYSFN